MIADGSIYTFIPASKQAFPQLSQKLLDILEGSIDFNKYIQRTIGLNGTVYIINSLNDPKTAAVNRVGREFLHLYIYGNYVVLSPLWNILIDNFL